MISTTGFRAITEYIILYALYIKHFFDLDFFYFILRVTAYDYTNLLITNVEYDGNLFVLNVIDAFLKIHKLFFGKRHTNDRIA